MAFSFETLTPEEFDAFSAAHPQGNFQQTSAMGSVREAQGTKVSYLGVKDEGLLVAACLFELHKSSVSSFAVIHDGPLCDYHNKELVRFMTEQLKAYADKAGASQLEITPEVVYQYRDSDGAPHPELACDTQTVDLLNELGYIHDGFTTGYTAVPRWRYVKDLTGIEDEDALMKSYTPDRRRNVRIARDSCVTIHYASRDELKLFFDIYQYNVEKYDHDKRPLEYYEQLFDAFGDEARFGIATIDLGAYKESFQNKCTDIEREIAQFEQAIKDKLEQGGKTDKLEKKLADARDRLRTAQKRVTTAEELIAEDGLVVPIDVDLFMWHPRECVGLFAASNPKYTQFCATALIQHEAMLEACRRDVRRYNSYGITGIFGDPEDPGYGVLSFKQRFLGYVEEMVGSFTLPVKPLAFKAKQFAHKILGR